MYYLKIFCPGSSKVLYVSSIEKTSSKFGESFKFFIQIFTEKFQKIKIMKNVKTK